MAYTILVAGVDVTSYVLQDTVVARDTVEARGDTMDFEMRISAAATGKPQAGNIVRWSSGAIKEFEGIITSVTPYRVGAPTYGQPDVWHYRCHAIDYTFLLDRILVKKNYPAQAADVTVIDIIDTYTSGFTTGEVDSGAATLGELSFDHVYVSEALTQLARACGWQWWVDFDRVVHFHASELTVAPLPDINLDTETRIFNFEGPSETVEQVKNRVYLKDFKVLQNTPYTEVFYGDGTGRFFGLANEPSIDKSHVVVRVNGGLQSLLWDFTDGQPGDGMTATGSAFFCFDNWGVRFPDGNPLPLNATAEVIYSSYRPENIYRMDDIPSQIEMTDRIGEDGVFEFLQTAQQIRAGNYDPIEFQGLILLSLYAPVRKNATFTTFVTGWEICQATMLTSTANDFEQRMYTGGVTKRPVTAVDQDGDVVTEYTVELRSKADVYF